MGYYERNDVSEGIDVNKTKNVCFFIIGIL